MNRQKLILNNLRHFRLANLAVIAGTLIATAVLTGALMVGDSVRGSLRELTLKRLGPVDHALQSSRFFPQDLAQRIESHPDFSKHFQAAAPAILINGGVSRRDGQRTLRTTAQIGATGKWISAAPNRATVNEPLRSALEIAGGGEAIELSVPAASDTPRDAPLAQRGAQHVTVPFSSRVGGIAPPDSLAAGFNLSGTQRQMPLAWTTLTDLQQALEQRGRINAILVQGAGGAEQAARLNQILRDVDTLADHSLSLAHNADRTEAILNSASTYVLPGVLDAARDAARAIDVPIRESSIYLINNVIAGDRRVHYAIAAGLNRVDDQPLRDDEVILNQWMADQLGAKPGDVIRLDYYKRQNDGTLREVSGGSLRIARIIPMSGIGADASLTPAYPGLTDASSVANWEPPEGLHIDKKLVSKADEDYWEKHKAAPKLFVTLATAERLWGSAFGTVNSVRVPAWKRAEFEVELLKRLDPRATGLAFGAVKAEALKAAESGTDFSGLFIGLSFFIIVAAAMLVAMLFRLAIEQRARQFGLLGALGFTPGALRWLALFEGLLLALIGGILGVIGAIGYTALIMKGLSTWWVDAVGTTALRLQIMPMTLVIGMLASLCVAGTALLFAVWRLGKAEAVQLLSGGWNREGLRPAGSQRSRTLALPIAIGALILGIGLVLAGVLALIKPAAAFIGGGALLLIGFIAASAAWFGASHRAEARSLPALGARNAGRNRGRSLLTVGLIAFASFVLVAVSAFKQPPPANPDDRAGGTGGFRLILNAQTPLTGDLSLPSGRSLLGMNTTDGPLLDHAKFVSMRSWAGQDMSCLNLTRPSVPTILAVPPALVERKPFTFAGAIDKVDNPWSLLDARRGDAIPVIADHEAATYILKKSIGDVIELTDQAGRPRKLMIIATLSHSIFQSELLMSQRDFLELFPSQSGFGTVLIETSAPDQEKLAQLLSSELGDFAVTVEPTAERLYRYQQVANTYISTFQTLGSLGLLLGTIGLAVILLRGLVERRSELALLSAIGFSARRRLGLVLSENVLLLLLGLAIGATCALVGVAPAIWSGQSLNLLQLSLALLAVLLTGLIVLLLAVWTGARHISPADLRGE